MGGSTPSKPFVERWSFGPHPALMHWVLAALEGERETGHPHHDGGNPTTMGATQGGPLPGPQVHLGSCLYLRGARGPDNFLFVKSVVSRLDSHCDLASSTNRWKTVQLCPLHRWVYQLLGAGPCLGSRAELQPPHRDPMPRTLSLAQGSSWEKFPSLLHHPCLLSITSNILNFRERRSRGRGWRSRFKSSNEFQDE